MRETCGMVEEGNVCCPYFSIMPCQKLKEHAHLYCFGQPFIDNKYAMKYCLKDKNVFAQCMWYKEVIPSLLRRQSLNTS